MINTLKKSIRYAGIIILFIILYKTNWRVIISTLSGINFVLLFLTYLLVIPRNLCVSYRWHLLLRHFSINRSYWDDIKVFYSGLLVGLITPGRIGELYRVTRLSKEGYSKILVAFLTFIARFFDISLILAVSFFGIHFLMTYSGADTVYVSKIDLWIGISLIVFIYVIIFGLKKYSAGILVRSIHKMFKIDVKKEILLQNLNKLNFRLFLKIGILTILTWLIYYYHIYLIAMILGIQLSFGVMILMLAIVTIVAALPITILGLGTREFAMINCFLLLGIEKERSLSLSLMVYTIMICDAIISTFLWNLEHKNIHQTKAR